MKKQLLLFALAASLTQSSAAQGWPADYGGVMLQGFYWDSFNDSRWTKLEAQSNEIAPYFSLIWVPQSGNCNTTDRVMGYLPVYLFDHNSTFGTTSELRSMIQTYKQKGTGIIADVVINHRNNLGKDGSWTDYPAENYHGVTYQMTAADICADDDGGKTAQWAAKQGQQLSSNKDSGEDWSGCRDIDHASDNVRNNYNAYLKFLLEDLGYIGFRYDMVKGYAPSYVAQYNHTVHPQFSVGEYWDNSTKIKSWINGTKIEGIAQSAAFDFPFRYTVRDAANSGDWSQLINLSNRPLIDLKTYRQHAITFIENHDTQWRKPDEELDPIKKDTLAANAYLLAMPGTPCVFYRHWIDHKGAIKAMINARRLAGVTNTSVPSVLSEDPQSFAVAIKGNRCRLLCVVGDNADNYVVSPSEYVKIVSGRHYAYFVERRIDALWIEAPSGEYTSAFTTHVVAASPIGTHVVYTLDGSTPTSSSPKVSSDGVLKIDKSLTLTAGLLHSDGTVTDIEQRTYTLHPFATHSATIYVRNENAWPTINYHVWNNRGESSLTGAWPGKRATAQQSTKGYVWNYETFDIIAPDYYVNVVFSTGDGSPQTEDVVEITNDRFYVITNEIRGNKYVVKDVTDTVTGLSQSATKKSSSRLFDLSGRPADHPCHGEIYVNDKGTKILH